jgi:hypothetical protein
MSRHNFDYVSTDSQEVKTVVSRTEATQLLVLDSKNRNVSAQPGGPPISQPWNYFRLQRPQSLMQTYATRIAVTEIRFPWYIPNITTNNNKLYISNGFGAGEFITITLPPSFYTPKQIVTEVNQQIQASTLAGITELSYNDSLQTYTFTQGGGNGDPWGLFFIDPTLENQISQANYESSANLCKTLGFTFYQSNGSNIGEGGYFSFTGNPTESLYTEYIDIVSEKLNYYSDQKDGSSDPLTSQALVCRLYLADEVSMGQNEGSFFQPFLIHRQFKTSKTLMWNKDAVVDWLDISVYDAWGQLVPLPTINYGTTTTQGSYPNFQITLLATEN